MNGNTSKTSEQKNGVQAEKKGNAVKKGNTAAKVNSVDNSEPAKKEAAEKAPAAENKKPSQLAFYEEVYKQLESGNDGIVAALPYTDTKALKNLLVQQQKSYETLAIDLKMKINQMGGKAEKPKLMEKMMMKGGMMMETLVDKSQSKLAELVLKGVNMGVISLTRLLNDAKSKEIDVQFGNKLMSLYEKQIDVLKNYL